MNKYLIKKQTLNILDIIKVIETGIVSMPIAKIVAVNGAYNADGYSQVTVAIPTYDGVVV